VLAQWRLLPDGAIDTGPPGGNAAQNLVTANGGPATAIAARTNERLRLRLVNAAAGVMTVRLDRHRVRVMALDGQPAEPFAARDGRVFLGPGNRADLFVDLTLEAGASADIVATTEAGESVVARLAYETGAPARAAPLPEPAPLPANPLPTRMDLAGALKLDLPLGGDPAGKGGAMDEALLARPAFAVKRGRTVSLGLANRSDRLQVVRLDGHAFRLLDRLDDGWKPFWLDTLVVPAGQTARIAFVADNPGAWAIAGHDGDSGKATMATWFAVT
jgi:FtsP/CotA-like multicopper oxidase with cupredoxin domain